MSSPPPLTTCLHGYEWCCRCCVDYRPLNAARSSTLRPLESRASAVSLLTAPGAPLELVRNARGHRVFRHAPVSVREMVETRMATSGAAFVTFEEERTRTYSEVWAEAMALASVLQKEYGVRKGHTVSVCMRNCPEYVVVMLAGVALGAMVALLNSHWEAPALAYAVKDAETRVLFVDEERLRIAPEGVPLLVSVRVTSHEQQQQQHKAAASYESLMQRASSLGPPTLPPLSSEDYVFLLYTSGSTGMPKGVAHTNLHVITAVLSWELESAVQIAQTAVAPPYVPQHCTLLAVPLFHVLASHSILLGSIRAQRHVVMMRKWDVARAGQLIQRHRVTMFSGPSTMTGDLIRHAKSNPLPSLMIVGGGGAARAPQQVKDIASTGVAPSMGWGMTETCASGCTFSGPDYIQRPLSSGLQSPIMEMRIISDNGGVESVPGARGELQVRGASVVQRYWKRPDADKSTFTPDGYLKTGDIASIDADGFVYILDRQKDLVIRGGENIGCGAVEAAIVEHPACHEACVFSVPDERMVEEVGAVVYTKDHALTAEALRSFLASRLARFEIPRYILFRHDALPRLGSGKVAKLEIRAEALKVFLGGAGAAKL